MNRSRQYKERQRASAKKTLIVCLVSIIVIAIVIGVWIIFFRQPIQLPNDSISIQNIEAVEKNKNSISVPGYEGITLKADSLEQTVALSIHRKILVIL